MALGDRDRVSERRQGCAEGHRRAGRACAGAWTEQVPVQRYIRYTEEELAAREKERQQAEEAARLPETIASLTCQLTDLQLALCELYEGGGV